MESHNSGNWTNLMGFAGLVLDWRPDSGDRKDSRSGRFSVAITPLFLYADGSSIVSTSNRSVA